MIVVSDTSPITNLLQIGELDLLRRIFGEIIVPIQVFNELCQIESQKNVLGKQEWIKFATPSNRKLKDELLEKLDEGESEAIALAIELKADYLLMDEQAGRLIAQNYGIKVTGILGVLIQAKDKGLISEVKPLLDGLVSDAGFWLNPKLIEEVLKLVGE